MATKFLEPGGDATFNVALTSAGGFWGAINSIPAVATDFVHGNHVKSIKYRINTNDSVTTPTGVVSDAGGRFSFYLYIAALPSGANGLAFGAILTSAASSVVRINLTSAGVLQLWRGPDTAQIGANGSTLSTGIWYRISLAYTIASGAVNEFRLFKNGVLDISVTNAALATVVTSECRCGNIDADAAFDIRTSDHYVDNSSSLTDPGNIWVTAKRPNANGTTNGFSTQIGAGGSGYGSGHSPQVNERALSNTNGWSMIGAGSAITEEYNIEAQSVGDINITGATIVDWLGWVDIKSLAGETVQIVLAGANTAQAITSTETLYTVIKGSATYPPGSGADIGVITDTSLTTVSLYECGVVVAYIPASATTTVHLLSSTGVGS